MASANKSHKKQKPPKSRPISTSAISQPPPIDNESSSLASLSAFSPDGKWFALLSLAIDKHRLRVFDTQKGYGSKVVAEYVLQVSSVTSLRWGKIKHGDANSHQDAQEWKKSKSKKRKKTKDEESVAIPSTQVIVLGLANGSVTCFSPTHGTTIISLSDSASTSPILDAIIDEDERHLWTSSGDGFVRLWDTQETQSAPIVYSSRADDDRTPYSTLALCPQQEAGDSRRILAAHHNISLIELGMEEASLGDTSKSRKFQTKARFTGHASTISSIKWIPSEDTSLQAFVTTAERDRFVQGWKMPSISPFSAAEGAILFSASVDGTVRKVQFSPDGTLLLVISSTGNISVFSDVSSATGGQPLEAKSIISVAIVAGKMSEPVKVLDAIFISGEGSIQLACIVEGARPVFHSTQLTDSNGQLQPRINVKISKSAIAKMDDQLSLPQRYREKGSIVVGSGAVLPDSHDAGMEDIESAKAEGNLDTGMAELTLGQRLKAVAGEELHDFSSDSSQSDVGKRRRKKNQTEGAIEVPNESLSRTLIQALHSGDTKLLEACLRHSDLGLIRNTVKRLPQQLTVPLLTACVERLGRGRGGNTGRGRGAAASAQRGSTIVAWVRTVLIVHSGYLMTLPNLVARLSSLHATLTSRLALQERLLLLNGRLDLALAQVELRWSKVPGAPPVPDQIKGSKKGETVTRYVEGDSGDEDEMQVEVEKGSDDESIEEIGLRGTSDAETAEESEGGESEEDEDMIDEEESDEEDESEGSADSLRLNGIIDDEAEESWGSEEDEEEEED